METPSTASATGRCKHWLTGSYNGDFGSCPHCEIEELRALAIACRSSVKTDMNAYERLLVAKQKLGEQQTPTYIAAEVEAQRLFELLGKIDALTLTTPNDIVEGRDACGASLSHAGLCHGASSEKE